MFGVKRRNRKPRLHFETYNVMRKSISPATQACRGQKSLNSIAISYVLHGDYVPLTEQLNRGTKTFRDRKEYHDRLKESKSLDGVSMLHSVYKGLSRRTVAIECT